MTMPVNLNIVSARLSANASIGRRFSSGSSASAMPKITLNTTTCRICASTTDARDVLREDVEDDVLPRPRGAGCGSWLASTAAGRAMPSPARLIVMAAQPMSSASVVTTSK